MTDQSTRSRWGDIRGYVGHDGLVVDEDGVEWRWRVPMRNRDLLLRADDETVSRTITDAEGGLRLPTPPIPEPPDGTRIEFECDTDLYAAHREDASSEQAGWPPGHGWLLYGHSVPCTWAAMWAQFGESLRLAVRLVPAAEDLPNREQWPTVVWARENGTQKAQA